MKTKFIISVLFAFYSSFCLCQNFTDSNLPIIILSPGNLPIDSAYSPTFIINMKVIDNGPNRNHLTDPPTFQGPVKIKVHGNSTQWFPKKAWNITTIKNNATHASLDTNLLGLPSEHDWIFKAQYQDKTLLRDALTFRIYRNMGHYGSRIKFFELVVNGDYRGVYELEEKIKRGKDRVKIAKLKAADVTGDSLSGGYIVHIDRLKLGNQGWTSNYPSSPGNDSANIYVYEYPNPDSMVQVQKDYIHHLFDHFEGVMSRPNWKSIDSGYTKYMNLNSLVDKFLIEELSRNTDGYRLKDYFYKDKNTKGDGEIHVGPVWDYEIGWGNCAYSGGNDPYWWQYSQPYHGDYIPFYWRKIPTDPAFINALKCRYTNLRSTFLNKTYLYAYLDSLSSYLSEGIQRNFQRWPILGVYVWPNPQPVPPDYAGEIGYLKWWIDQRLSWLDKNITGVCVPTGIQELTSQNMFSIFPNPFGNSLKIVYDIPANSSTDEKKQVVIEIFDVLGNRVYLSFADKSSGSHSTELSTSQLASGIYTIRISMDDKIFSSRIIKEK